MRCKNVGDGEWVRPRRKGYYMQCCDCGLIHRMDFRLVRVAGGRKPRFAIIFRAFRVTRRKRK